MYKAKLIDRPLADMRTIVERLNATPTDTVCGCLLDNYLYWTGSHYIAFTERYVNSNQSGYDVWVAEFDKDDEDLIDIFTQLYQDLYEQYIGA